MTRRRSHPSHAPFEVDLGKTQSQLLFARAQACAHAAAADYLRIRDMGRRAGRSVTAEDAQTSSSGTT